jgi:excisionase family DNA binding protein
MEDGGGHSRTGRQCYGQVVRGRIIMWSDYADDEKLLTKGEVARLCRVDIRTVERWVMAGKVGCHRTPSGRVLFRRHDVLTLVVPTQASPRHRG